MTSADNNSHADDDALPALHTPPPAAVVTARKKKKKPEALSFIAPRDAVLLGSDSEDDGAESVEMATLDGSATALNGSRTSSPTDSPLIGSRMNGGNIYIPVEGANGHAGAPKADSALHDAVPPHLELSRQPPCADVAPDVWHSKPLYWDALKNLTYVDVLKFLVFLAAGPAVALACLALDETIYLCYVATQLLVHSQPYWYFLIMPLAFPAILYASETWFVGSAGSGIPKALLAFRLCGTKPKRPPKSLWDDLWNGGVFEGHISLKLSLGKWILSIMSIASGASVGPEGPAVQIGSGIAASMQKIADLPFFYPKAAVMAGAAVGLGTLFGAPIAGLVFAIEEVAGIFEFFGLRISVLSMIALGGLVTSSIRPYEPILGERSEAYVAIEWVIVPVAGISLGLLGGIFTRMNAENLKWRKANPAFLAKWNYPIAAVMGFCVACLGIFTEGAVFGPGMIQARGILDDIANPNYNDRVADVLFGPLKFLAALCSGVSGIPGGQFVPFITIGIGMGRILAYMFPFVPTETVVILSSIAYFSGVTQGPFTSVLVLFELTRFQSSHLYPALAIATLASFVSKVACPYTFYAYVVRVANQPVPESKMECQS